MIPDNISPTELTREQVGNQTIQTDYLAGYTITKVTSVFSDGNPFVNQLSQVIQRKLLETIHSETA